MKDISKSAKYIENSPSKQHFSQAELVQFSGIILGVSALRVHVYRQTPSCRADCREHFSIFAKTETFFNLVRVGSLFCFVHTDIPLS